MGAESEKDTSQTAVTTYLPAYQREEWDDHADELDMSRSEFVKAMVQAGRKGFDGAERPTQPTTPPNESTPIPQPDVDDSSLEETVVDALSRDEYRSWDELLAVVSDDIEDRLEETLQRLQSDDEVRYSGRHGGYTLER